ncbi:MAG: hypothetical protein EZS28_035202, partial [Streblomastix strix]
MAEILLGQYIKNPDAYVGQKTRFNGKIESSQDYEQQGIGTVIFKVLLDFQLSGAQTNEPIYILVDGTNPTKDECITYIGKDKVLEFECEILTKPQGIHWFKLIKTSW